MPNSFSDNKYIYSVDLMIAYLYNKKPKYVNIEVKKLLHNMDYKCWGNPEIKELYSPHEVLNNPKKYKKDYDRILGADLSYPIIVSNEMNVIDGMHRLSKAYLENKKTIKVHKFNKTMMKKFIVGKKNEWDKVNKIRDYDLIILYLNRFG